MDTGLLVLDLQYFLKMRNANLIMNALLLPGNSPRHVEWIEKLKLALVPHFQLIEAQHYRHWQRGEENADVDYEIGVAQKKASELNPYIVVAKSIGTVVAAKGTAEGKLQPDKLILLGVPINGGVSKDLFFEWLKQAGTPDFKALSKEFLQ